MKYLRTHGRGHKYQRGIPRDLQPLYAGRRVRTVYYDSTVSAAEAQRKAMVQWAADGLEFERLSALSTDERDWLLRTGGVDNLDDTTAALKDSIEGPARMLMNIDKIDPPGPFEFEGKRYEISRDQFTIMIANQLAASRQLKPLAELNAKLVSKMKTKTPEATDLGRLLDLWETVVAPQDPRSREKYGRALRLFIQAVGDIAPSGVMTSHAAAFRDWLGDPAREMGIGAQQKTLDYVRAIFSAAVKDGKLSSNPFMRVNPRKPKGGRFVDLKKKLPFAAGEVRLVLAKLNILTGQTSNEDWRRDIEWVIKLATYHGCRINEVANLRKQDVRQVDGIWCLDVNDEERRIKNPTSVRTVPLHPKCSGFIKHVARSEGPWVFDLTYYREGQRAGWIIRRFGAFLDEIGITRPKVSLHSLRHRWIDAARAAGVPEDIRRAIVGHDSEAGAHGDYGSGFDVKTMLPWLRKVDPLRG
ncbi:MAG: site-specific integrase [Hyphomicrobiaceae bacterium]